MSEELFSYLLALHLLQSLPKLLLPTKQSIRVRSVDTHDCGGGNHSWFDESNNQSFQRGNKLVPISSKIMVDNHRFNIGV